MECRTAAASSTGTAHRLPPGNTTASPHATEGRRPGGFVRVLVAVCRLPQVALHPHPRSKPLRMILRLTRLDERRYETEITRSDGVTYRVKGVGHMGAIPHDLAHFAIEQGLGIRGGFWGSVAQGAVFGSLTHVSGRRRPKAAARSEQILRENRGELTETEILVGLFNQALEEGLGPESAELRARLRRFVWTAPGRRPRQFTDDEIAAACGGWRRLLHAWQALPIGETMDLAWPEPGQNRRRVR